MQMSIIVQSSDSGDELETFDVAIEEVQPIIDLFKDNTYMDDEGNEYVFDGSQIEPNKKLVIFVEEAGE